MSNGNLYLDLCIVSFKTYSQIQKTQFRNVICFNGAMYKVKIESRLGYINPFDYIKKKGYNESPWGLKYMF